MARLPPCVGCGACCCVYAVDVDDEEPIPKRLTHYFPRRDGWREMRMENGRCIALRGQVGKGAWCSIYDKRPRICRNFPRGSPGCLESRIRTGLVKGDLETNNYVAKEG